MICEPSEEELERFKRGNLRTMPRVLDSARNQFIVAASLGVGIGTSMNAYALNHTTLGFASALSDSLAASTLLSNGVSVASLVAVGLSCVLPLPPAVTGDGGEAGGKSGSGQRGYAQLDRESVAVPVSDSEEDADTPEAAGGDLAAEVVRLRDECRQLRRSNAELEGLLGGGETDSAAATARAAP
jgi:hypothetical protein